MSWRDRLRPASFRGVAFFVREAEAGVSRNVVEHEYPGQAPPYFEDLGRRARTWTIEGYVVGDDYQAQRDRLVTAAESEDGPGDIVHPYYGTLRVHCRGISVRESASEGRMARVLLQFVEASEQVAPTSVADESAAVDEATGSLYTASADDFEEAWNPVDEPAILVEAGAAESMEFVDYLSQVNLSGPSALVAEWRDKLADFGDRVVELLHAPRAFATEATALLDSLIEVVGSRRAAIEVYLGLYDVEDADSFGSSSASQLADANRDAVGRIFREAAAALAARASAETEWDNYADALSARSRALDALTAAQDVAGDAAYRELANVGRALAEALPLAPGTLPGIQDYVVPDTTSAVALAYRLYDDVSRAEEIVARNRIANPLLIVGGTTLEVLAVA
jgi:prophage DNA circulation protein